MYKENLALNNLQIFTVSCKPLKLVDQFSYLGTNNTSIESDVNIRRPKTRNAIDKLSRIWKSYPSDKIKRNFF